MSTVTRRTYQWCAPEVSKIVFNNNQISLYVYQLQLFQAAKHSMESDVYAYGVVLWEVVTHDEPYKDLNDMQIMFKVINEV